MKDEKIMKYVPKHLVNAVEEAFRDNDGYWIRFKKEYTDTHMNRQTVHGNTISDIIVDIRNAESNSGKLQKNFNVSSLENKKLIETGIAAFAEEQHQSESNIIENILLKTLYPHECLKNIEDIKAMLYNVCACFETHGSIEMFEFITRYCYLNCDRKSTFPNDKDELRLFYYRMPDVIYGMSESIENMTITDFGAEIIEKHSDDKYSVDVTTYEIYKARLDYAKSLFERTKENPERVQIWEYFELLFDFSKFIGDKDYAYKFVALLLELESLKMKKSCKAIKLYNELKDLVYIATYLK